MTVVGRRYLDSHEWGLLEGSVVTVGLSDFAVKHLSDLVFIQLPEVGDKVEGGDGFGEIESVKAVSELSAPVSGEVVEVNEAVQENLELISSDPHGEGWLVKIRIDDPAEFNALLEEEEYTKQIAEEEDVAEEPEDVDDEADGD